MFPRLHVNDKAKGGPRAPPRNKMALYEQLSIPSQRFNPGLLPPNSLQTSSSKGISDARNLFVPSHLSPLGNSLDEKSRSRLNSGANFGSMVTQIVQEKREGDGDDCSVPVFVQSETRQNVTEREEIATATPKTFNQQLQGERDSARRRIFSLDTNSKEDIVRKCKVSGSQDQELEDLAVSTSANENAASSKSKRDKKRSKIPRQRTALSCSDENLSSNPKQSDCVYVKGDSPEKDKTDRTEAVSVISTMDSISCSDVSPDDIVGVIGQPHFWKARETIANQQRVFAFQLFELHRLIKVQQSIAGGSPQLCIKDRVFLESSTPKVSPTTKLSSRCIDKVPLPVLSSEASEKSNCKMECSVADPNMASWVFPHSSAHHWLVPVMSPTEGLVYKACPAPGFIGTFPPPYGSSQSMGGLANPAQGIGVFPISPLTGHHHIHPCNIPPENSTASRSVADQTKFSRRSGSNCRPSCSYVPTQKSGLVPSVARSANELQPRIGSCNGDKDQTHSSECPNGVIKVVPRNPRSASESAARIFQSIQEERKHQLM